MADAIDFQLRLIDRMTAPARQMQRSIGALEKSLKAELTLPPKRAKENARLLPVLQ